jgi:hypothetical protein
MKHTSFQIIKTTSDLDGVVVGREIHCLCENEDRCLAELRRMYTAKWIGYPIIEKVIGERILVVDTDDSMVVYSIKAVEHIAKRPTKRYVLMPKLGRASDGKSFANYGEALEEKIRLERLTGEKYIIAK